MRVPLNVYANMKYNIHLNKYRTKLTTLQVRIKCTCGFVALNVVLIFQYVKYRPQKRKDLCLFTKHN